MLALRSVILLGLFSALACQPYINLLQGTFPATSWMGAAVSLPNGHIYVLGGEDATGTLLTNATLLYTDPLSNPVLKAPMTSARTRGCAVLVDDKYIYYIGGKIATPIATGQIMRYNISADSWEVLPPPGNVLTKPRFSHTCVFDSSTREIVILFGTDTSGAGDTSSFTVEKFNVDSGALATVNYPGSMPNHGSAANAVYDPSSNLIYVIGGNADATTMTILSQSLGWLNDTTTPNSTIVAYSSVSLINGEIWVFVGMQLLIYNINNGTWREGSVSTGLDWSGSNLAPVSGPNIHIFAKANFIAACVLPCPTPSSPCQVNECDNNSGRCVTSPIDNGKSCGNADGCTGSNCVCTDGQCLPGVLNADVRPYFECYAETGRGDTMYTAYLSWNNAASSNVVVQKGSPRNQLNGLAFVPTTQPDLFLPGYSRSYPINDFQLQWNGSEITWTLTNYHLTIDAFTPSLLCSPNTTLYIVVRGDTLNSADLPLITTALARLFGITESRIKLSFYTGTKRQSDQTLELEIQSAPPQSSEPSSEQIVQDFVDSVANNSTDPDAAVSVNGKNVAVVSVTTKPPSNARPGVAAPAANPNGVSEPTGGNQPTTKVPSTVSSGSSLGTCFALVIGSLALCN